MDDLIEDLDVTLSRKNQHGDSHGRLSGRRTEQPLPFNEAASEAVFALTSALVAWARDAVDPTRAYMPELYATVNPKDPARLPDRLTTAGLAARVLVDHIHVLANSTEAGTAYDEIVSAIGQARRVIDRPLERRYLGQCRAADEDGPCGADLYVVLGYDTYDCPQCGVCWDVQHLREALADRVPEQTGTTSTIAGWLRTVGIEVSGQTVRRWAREERLRPANRDGRGRALYRFGDALDAHAHLQLASRVKVG